MTMSDLSKLAERLELFKKAIADADQRHIARIPTYIKKAIMDVISENEPSLRAQAIAGQQAITSSAEGVLGDEGHTQPVCPAPDAVTEEMLAAGADCAGMQQVNSWVTEMQLARGRKAEWSADNPPLAQAYRAMRPLDPYIVALERDARRYRWLRSRAYGQRDELAPNGQDFVMNPPDVMDGQNIMKGSLAEHLDAAIDQAREKSDER